MPHPEPIPLDAVLSVVGEPVFTDIPGETVILDERSGRYFGLDDVGSFVWRHLQRTTTLRHLVAAVTAEYDVNADRSEADLRALIADLRAVDLVAVGPEARG
ncbi:MAG: PqqD family protein [Trueperaceae bacterium]|nr:PqqD family protein [Trueperaceae bacterium]